MNLMRMLREYYGKYRLTVSGDISIASSIPTELYELTGEQRQHVQEIIDELHAESRFLKVEIKNGINESEIRFFSYNAALNDAHFLEQLQQRLTQMAEVIAADEQTAITINFSGIFYRGQNEEHFRFLNKGTAVQYKITHIKKRTIYDYIVHSRYMRIALTILLVVVLGWLIYNNLSVRPQPEAKLV